MITRKRLVLEGRILGRVTVCAPLLLSAAYLVGLLVVHAMSGMAAASAFMSWLFIQGLLPLLVGYFAAAQGAPDAAGELSFALPVAYEHIALARLSLVLALGAGCVMTTFTMADALGAWPKTAPVAFIRPFADVAECAACLLVLWGCAAVGWGCSAVSRSATASRVALALLWITSLIASATGGDARVWVTTQVAWALGGGVSLLVGWQRARKPEWTLSRMEE